MKKSNYLGWHLQLIWTDISMKNTILLQEVVLPLSLNVPFKH